MCAVNKHTFRMTSVPDLAKDDETEVTAFLTAEEEDALSTSFLNSSAPALNEFLNQEKVQSTSKSIEEHMKDLEQTFESGMQLATSTASVKKDSQQQQEDPLRTAYAELHSPANADLVQRLKLAMQDIPKGTKGLDACKSYFSQKQYYTMLDVLVAQYVLNDGLLMRQHHDMQDEYHVDLAEGLDSAEAAAGEEEGGIEKSEMHCEDAGMSPPPEGSSDDGDDDNDSDKE